MTNKTDLENMLKDQNEELERAYERLNDKDNEIKDLKSKLYKEHEIYILLLGCGVFILLCLICVQRWLK